MRGRNAVTVPAAIVLVTGVLVTGVLVTSVAATASPSRLNGPLVAGGDVAEFAVAPDGSHVVYLADQDTDDVFEVYSVAVGGGAPTRLNGPMVTGGDVVDFGIGPDSSRVVYLADEDADETFELFAAPLGGGPAAKLNGTPAPGGDVASFSISPDGQRVVYRADETTAGVVELYSVPIGGGAAPTKLNDTLTAGGAVTSFRITPDSGRVVYRADQAVDDQFELFGVAITGGPVTKLNDTLVADGDVDFFFTVSPDSQRVVYRADRDTDETFELYSVLATGAGPPVELNGALPPGGDVEPFSFAVSPDSARVVYRADQDTDEDVELFSVPTGGGASAKLNAPLTNFGDVVDSIITPDGSRVVYQADQDTDEAFELFSVPVTGGAVADVSGPLAPEGTVALFSFAISSDSARVVYQADQETAFVDELFSAPTAGGGSTKLNAALAGGGVVLDFSILPDGSQVLYLADQDTATVAELYRVPIGGGPAVKVNAPLVAGGDVFDFGALPDSSRVLYIAEQDSAGVAELYLTGDIDAPSLSVTKGADPASLPEPGGTVTFTVTVTNTSSPSDPVTVTSLVDDVHGDLDGVGDCLLPQVVAAGDVYSCSFQAAVAGNAGDVHTDTVTAGGADDDGDPVSAADSVVVTIDPVAPSLGVTKTASPTSVVAPGGTVTFTVTVTNASVASDPVTIISLDDSAFGSIAGQGDCSVPQVVVPGGAYACSFEGVVAGTAGDDHVNTVAASGTDDEGALAQAGGSATVTVTAANAAPTALPQSVTLAEDSARQITLAGSDPEADPLAFTVVTGPANGVLTGTPPDVTYRPAQDFAGADRFTFRVNDGALDSNVATVSLTVTPVNDVPVAVNDGPFAVDEGARLALAAPGVLGNDRDVDGDPLAAQLVTSPSHGSLALGADGSFVYTHDGTDTTSDAFTYRATDGAASSAPATVSIAITPADDPIPTVGLVDPLAGRWHLRNSAGAETAFFFGNPGDFPMMGDWDCDGIDTPGLYRRADGFVYLRNSNTQGVADIRFFFGDPGDLPLAGDFDGDGCDTVSIYRPDQGQVFVINELGSDEGGLGAAEFSYFFGNPGDKPFVGDFDGDGDETVGLHRESTGLVYFNNEHRSQVAEREFIFGDPGDRLVAGDWNGNTQDSPALFRPATTTFFFRFTNTQGNADAELTFGEPTWLPVAGHFGLG